MIKYIRNKEESRLLKSFNKCKTRKCNKLDSKELHKASKTLRNEQNKKCPQKASNGFNDNDCLDKVYVKSKFSRILKNHIKCGKKECSKELNTLKKLREMLI
jgi:hypothetical protein